jgi:hypothetical protein
MSSSADASPLDARASARHLIFVPVAIESGATIDEGRLCDISATGGRIEKATVRPAIGDCVVITFAFSLSEPSFEIVSRVVRHTDQGGFAVHFEQIDPRLKDTVARAAAILNSLPDLSSKT